MSTYFYGLNILRLGAVATLFLLAQEVDGQALPGCRSIPDSANGNMVVRCRHITIEVEKGAGFRLIDRDRDGEPDRVTLDSGAIYIEDAFPIKRHFQVQTPDALASVRGTTWAVDVTPKQSSIFVAQGHVGVERRLDRQSVTLSAGEGVDVAPETAPLVVKHWPVERVRALLARLGH